jgi:L-ribulokinase
MWAAVAAGSAAGGYDRIEDAAAKMARLRDERYVPDPARAAVYDDLYAEYRALHDYFGRGANDAMKRLRAIRDRALATAAG